MKAVLMSIQPKWIELIARGEKTIEIRKTKPKLETPFKCYIYCTNDRKVFLDSDCNNKFWTEKNYGGNHYYNGKVIGEFVCDRIDRIGKRGVNDNFDYCYLSLNEWGNDDIEIEITDIKKSCISKRELNSYGANATCLYGWHISDLKIYDKPKELSEFYKPVKYDNVCGARVVHCGHYQGLETVDSCEYNDGDCSLKGCKELRNLYQIKRPPQSWCYVEELQGE